MWSWEENWVSCRNGHHTSCLGCSFQAAGPHWPSGFLARRRLEWAQGTGGRGRGLHPLALFYPSPAQLRQSLFLLAYFPLAAEARPGRQAQWLGVKTTWCWRRRQRPGPEQRAATTHGAGAPAAGAGGGCRRPASRVFPGSFPQDGPLTVFLNAGVCVRTA